jgi:anti-anti-sigma factor
MFEIHIIFFNDFSNRKFYKEEPMGLDVNIQKEGKNLAVVSVKGTLDAHFAPEFEKKVNEYLKNEKLDLIIDLKGVPHIASAGFGALMPIKNIQDDRNKKMVLASLQDNVEKVFKLLGFNNVLQAYKSVDEAKKAL